MEDSINNEDSLWHAVDDRLPALGQNVFIYLFELDISLKAVFRQCPENLDYDEFLGEDRKIYLPTDDVAFWRPVIPNPSLDLQLAWACRQVPKYD